MTKGIRDLRQIQIAFQKVAGLTGGAPDCSIAVTPSARLAGTCGMKKTVNRVFPAEPKGLMSSHILGRHYDPWLLCEVPIGTGEDGLTFQQIVWYLAMGIQSGGTGTTWAFVPNLTAGDLPDLATIRYGDNAAVWQTTCAFARQLVISGAAQGVWNMEADIVGRDMDNTYLYNLPYGMYGTYPTDYHPYYDIPFVAGIVHTGPLDPILGQKTSFYLAESCLFTTQRTGYLIDWTLTIPGFHPKFFQDGELYYTTMGLASRHLTWEATVEFDDEFTKHILWDAWVAGTPIYVRLHATGRDTLEVTIDMVLDIESFETLDERDGNDIIKFTARTVYSEACAPDEWSITVINEDAALPI